MHVAVDQAGQDASTLCVNHSRVARNVHLAIKLGDTLILDQHSHACQGFTTASIDNGAIGNYQGHRLLLLSLCLSEAFVHNDSECVSNVDASVLKAYHIAIIHLQYMREAHFQYP